MTETSAEDLFGSRPGTEDGEGSREGRFLRLELSDRILCEVVSDLRQGSWVFDDLSDHNEVRTPENLVMSPT